MSGVENIKLTPVVPKNGQIIIEDVQDFLLCKPRLIPLKSLTLEKLERMQQEAAQKTKETQNN